jgi:hypothetical protein
MSKELRLSSDVSLAGESASKVKRALLCRTGNFDGMFGPVEVTKERLEALAETYQKIRATPQNENDYAPILLDHSRSVDLVKGRLLPEGMSVEEWKEIDGVMEFGLFGNLRIDDPEAQANVESGKYAHLSISFDEDTNEIFEVSFVAVEAARGSIVLAKSTGGSMDLEKRFKALSQRHGALATHIKAARTGRKAALAKLMKERDDLAKEIETLAKGSKELAKRIKLSQLKGKMAEFVRQGRMEPVELKEIDFEALSEMNEKALNMYLQSFEKRPVSTDVFQYGQAGTKKLSTDLSPAAMRKAMELQRSGKAQSLAGPHEGDEDVNEKEKGLAEGEHQEPDGDEGMMSMSKEEFAKCLEEMYGHHSKLAESIEKMKGLGEEMKKLAEGEDDDEKKEKEMSAVDEKTEGEEE